jgi:hypothetical protein
MSKVLEFVVISLGVGTVVSLIRYFAVWYIVRRARRILSWRRRHHQEEGT